MLWKAIFVGAGTLLTSFLMSCAPAPNGRNSEVLTTKLSQSDVKTNFAPDDITKNPVSSERTLPTKGFTEELGENTSKVNNQNYPSEKTIPYKTVIKVVENSTKPIVNRSEFKVNNTTPEDEISTLNFPQEEVKKSYEVKSKTPLCPHDPLLSQDEQKLIKVALKQLQKRDWENFEKLYKERYKYSTNKDFFCLLQATKAWKTILNGEEVTGTDKRLLKEYCSCILPPTWAGLVILKTFHGNPPKEIYVDVKDFEQKLQES